MFNDRKTRPTKALGWEKRGIPSFLVWGWKPTYLEDTHPWKLFGAFRYLTCALDYIASCQDSGRDVIFQSPADCKLIRATDTRVVYKAPQAAQTIGCAIV